MNRARKIIHEAMEQRRPYTDYNDSGFYLHDPKRGKFISGPNTEEEAHRQRANHPRKDLQVVYRDSEGGWNIRQRTYPFMKFDGKLGDASPHL